MCMPHMASKRHPQELQRQLRTATAAGVASSGITAPVCSNPFWVPAGMQHAHGCRPCPTHLLRRSPPPPLPAAPSALPQTGHRDWRAAALPPSPSRSSPWRRFRPIQHCRRLAEAETSVCSALARSWALCSCKARPLPRLCAAKHADTPTARGADANGGRE